MAGSWPLPTVLSSNPPAQGMVFPYPGNFGEAQRGRPRWCPSRAAEKRVVGVQLIGFPGFFFFARHSQIPEQKAVDEG